MKTRLLLSIFAIVCSTPLIFPQADSSQDISQISIEDLLDVPVITASKYWQNISEAPASVTIITSKDIESYGYRNISEILQHVRSMYISYDRDYTYLGVRGFSRPADYNNRILLLINGHRMNENVYGSAFLGNEFGLDLSMIDRIEIVRGPGSALFGTNAMFAVINIFTKTGSSFDGLSVAGEYGSFDNKKAVLNFGQKFPNEVDFFISANASDITGQDLYFEEFDSDSTNNGIASDIDGEKYFGFYTSAAYKNFKLNGGMTYREKDIPTAPYSTVFNYPSYTLDRRNFIELSYNEDLPGTGDLLFKASYDNYVYKGKFPYMFDGDLYNLEDKSIGNWFGGEAQFNWNVLENNRLTIGSEINANLDASYLYYDIDTTYFDGNFPYESYSLYINDDFQPVDNLSLVAGVRGDKYSEMDVTFSPRAGIIFSPLKSTTLKLLYGEAFRIPNVYETNYYDYFSNFKVSELLVPEKIKTLELICEERISDKFYVIASLFHNEISDLIDTQMDPADSMLRFLNINEATAYGFELESSAKCKWGLRGYFNYTFQKTEDKQTNAELTNVPPHLFNLGICYEFYENYFVSSELHYETERTTVYNTKTPDFALVNFNLLLTPLTDNLKLILTVNNVFDEKYKTPGGFEHVQPAIEQNGRNYLIRADYRIF